MTKAKYSAYGTTPPTMWVALTSLCTLNRAANNRAATLILSPRATRCSAIILMVKARVVLRWGHHFAVQIYVHGSHSLSGYLACIPLPFPMCSNLTASTSCLASWMHYHWMLVSILRSGSKWGAKHWGWLLTTQASGHWHDKWLD